MMIREIMQVGVGLPDREKFDSFVSDMLGFPVLRSPDGSISYVRSDQYHTASLPARLHSRFCVM
jgi:hypothetical protein